MSKRKSPNSGSRKSATKSQQSATTTRSNPAPKQSHSHDEVACLAYLIWQEEGCQPGCDQRHWFEAQRRLNTQQETQAD